LFGRTTDSTSLPTHQRLSLSPAGSTDCFLTKLSNDGSTALYTVVFTNASLSGCVAMDASSNDGKVHLVFGTWTTILRTLSEATMPLTPLQGSYDIADMIVQWLRSDANGYVYLAGWNIDAVGNTSYSLEKVDSTGQLVGQFTLPGQAYGLDADNAGHAYVFGSGAITPTPNALPSVTSGGFLLRVDTNAAAFEIDYATYLGGTPAAIVADRVSGDVFVTGNNAAGDLPTTPGVVMERPVGSPPFLLRLNLAAPPSRQVAYGTYVPATAAFVEKEAPGVVVLRGQGGEEIVIAAVAAPGGSAVRGSSMLFGQQVKRFFTTLPPALAAEAALAGVSA